MKCVDQSRRYSKSPVGVPKAKECSTVFHQKKVLKPFIRLTATGDLL